MSSGSSTLIKDHLAGGASRLAALLLAQILPVFLLVAPCQPGAALGDLVLVRRGRATSRFRVRIVAGLTACLVAAQFAALPCGEACRPHDHAHGQAAADGPPDHSCHEEPASEALHQIAAAAVGCTHQHGDGESALVALLRDSDGRAAHAAVVAATAWAVDVGTRQTVPLPPVAASLNAPTVTLSPPLRI